MDIQAVAKDRRKRTSLYHVNSAFGSHSVLIPTPLEERIAIISSTRAAFEIKHGRARVCMCVCACVWCWWGHHVSHKYAMHAADKCNTQKVRLVVRPRVLV